MNWLTDFFSHKTTQPKSPAQDKAKPATSMDSMMQPCSPPLVECQQNLSTEQLKKFAPLRDLDADIISTIQHSTLMYPKDSIIFQRNQAAEAVYYVMEGTIKLQPNSDSDYEVKHGTTLAALPLNSGKVHGATGIALTDVTILKLSLEINRLWAYQSREDMTCVELVDINLPEQISNPEFFGSFCQAYRENKLRLPSLPNVALKLKQAMQHDIGIDQAAEIIQIDPPIVTKLIQVANSPLYASIKPVTNCHDAINRIGLNATRNLVLGISLKQLFHSQNRELMQGMQALWKSSLYISSLSFVLAQECSHLDPEDALLAGLICDIGAIPILHFAEQLRDRSPNFAEIQTSLPYLRGPVGSLVLHTLGFAEEFCNIPHLAENWLYDNHEQPTLSLAEIVILAKLHSYFGTRKAQGLPYINSIPAYAKIKDGKLNPDFSLMILQKAQNRIQAAMQLLS